MDACGDVVGDFPVRKWVYIVETQVVVKRWFHKPDIFWIIYSAYNDEHAANKTLAELIRQYNCRCRVSVVPVN